MTAGAQAAARVDGVLAVDGGRQDPTDFTEWDRTSGARDVAALDLAFAVRFQWSWVERHLDDRETLFRYRMWLEHLRALLDEFSARCDEHDAAVARMDAARRAAGLP